MNQHIWEPYPIQEQIHISDMYTLFQLHYDNDYAFFGETHNFWECLYVIKGRVCVSANERIYYLENGEIIFHKPMELHKFTIESPEGADLLIFSYSAEGNAAIDLLESGESVTTVAERTGFNNQSYFSKAFKRETGKTPSEYKH